MTTTHNAHLILLVHDLRNRDLPNLNLCDLPELNLCDLPDLNLCDLPELNLCDLPDLNLSTILRNSRNSHKSRNSNTLKSTLLRDLLSLKRTRGNLGIVSRYHRASLYILQKQPLRNHHSCHPGCHSALAGRQL